MTGEVGRMSRRLPTRVFVDASSQVEGREKRRRCLRIVAERVRLLDRGVINRARTPVCCLPAA